MNKIGKLLITCALVCGFLFAVAGCSTGNEPFVPPEPDGSKVSINDAYDWNEDKTGSTRPDLGGDYEPTLPPTEAVVTIAEGSAVRFKDGKTSLTLPLGNVLKAEDFDESTLSGRKIGGVGIVGETNKINSYIALEDFAPTGNATVSPYFAAENGDPYVFGSSKVGDYFYDGAGVEIKNDLTTEYVLVDGFMGRGVSYADELSAGSYFRAVTVCEREDEQEYTYYYRFENFGATDVAFTVYQMYGGHDWQDPEMSTASSPVTLAAGAKSDVVSINVTKSKNDANTLTLIKFDKAVTGLSLGVSMEVKNVTPTVPAKITLDLPAGFTVDGYETNVRTNDKIKLPTAAQITNNTGHNLLHWVYADGTKVVEGKRIKGDVTIKPVLTEDAIITFELPDGFTVSADYVTKLQTGDLLVLPTEEQITNTSGRKFIRWVDGQGNVVKNGVKVTGNMTLIAELSAPVAIGVQLPAGLTLSGDYVKTSQTGETIVPPAAEQVLGTIADGRTIVGWYVVGDNSVITDKSTYMDTQVTLAPIFSRRAGTATMCNFEDETLNGKTPVFGNIQSTNKPMNVYPTEGSTLAIGSFDAIGNKYSNDTAIGGGEGGYAELGNVLKYNGKMLAGDAFRCGTMLSGGAAVVDLKVEHMFHYNFENFGASDIHLSLQGVNNGTNVEGPVSKIDLKPGESTTVSFKVTYTSGSANKNILSYFKVTQDMSDMKLGVSINIVLGKARADVSLKSGIEGFTLSDDYLGKEYHVGDTLTLPTASDYTDTLSAKRSVIGWQDGKGNALPGSIVLSGNIELVPVFEYYANVTFELPEGITFTGGFESSKRYVVGETLVLPTAAQIENTLESIKYWVVKGTTEVVDNETVISEDMVIVPVLEQAQKEPVSITGDPELKDFEISAEYLDAPQYIGDLLVLPTADQFTNNTGKRFDGWKDKTTGKELRDGMVIEGDIVLVPMLTAYAEFTIELPAGLTLKESYNTKYFVGEALVAPTAEDIEANTTGMEAPLGWFDVTTGLAVTADTIVRDGLTIAPYWEHSAGYNYVKVGSGSKSGYNTDKMPGDIVIHADAAGDAHTVNYKGFTTATSSTAAIVYGGKNGYSVLGSVLSDTAPVTAGSAIRFDSKHAQTLPGTNEAKVSSVVEFNYTIQNSGTTPLNISIYQISASGEYKTPTYYAYESRYRVEVILEPGESVVKTAQYLLETNGNALTYVVFEKDVSSFSFGIAISSKIVEGATDVDAKYKDQAPSNNNIKLTYDPADNQGIAMNEEYLTKRVGHFITAPVAGTDYTPNAQWNITKWQLIVGSQTYDIPETLKDYTSLLLPSTAGTLKAVMVEKEDLDVIFRDDNGVNVTDAKTKYQTGDKLELPAISAATTDGRKHLGWFDTATNKIVTADTVVIEKMTLAPYFAPKAGTALTPGSGFQLDSNKVSDKGVDNFTGFVRDNFTVDMDVLVGDEKGTEISYSKAFADKDAFRVKTKYAIKAGSYIFTFKFVNYGNEEVKFTVYQVLSGNTTTNMPKQDIILAGGTNASAVATLTVNPTGTNGNALTYFVMNGAANGFDLGITMSVTEVTAV